MGFKINVDKYGFSRKSKPERVSRDYAAEYARDLVEKEEVARADADNGVRSDLEAKIAVEASTRGSMDDTLQGYIDNEATTRASADTSLSERITAEANQRAADDTILQNAVSAEGTARAEADAELGDRITAESGARSVMYEELIYAVSNETSLRNAAVANLQGQIDDKANKATTLAGYGIEDAYTKTEADTLLGGKVDANKDSIVIGVGTEAPGFGSVGIGWAAKAFSDFSVSIGAVAFAKKIGVAIGTEADASESCVAIGPYAKTAEDIKDAIQLGAGTNSNEKTFQVYDYQLMDAEGNIPAERLKNAGGGDLSEYAKTEDLKTETTARQEADTNLQEQIDAINNADEVDVSTITEDYYTTTFPKRIPYTIIEGSYAYVPATGDKGNIATWARGSHTEPIAVNPKDKFLISARVSATAPAVVFYNSAEPSSATFVGSSRTDMTGTTLITKELVEVPDGASYMVVNALDYSSIGLRISAIETAPKIDEIDFFNKRYLEKIKQLSQDNKFAWKPYERGILSIRIDGFYSDIDYFKSKADEYGLKVMFAGEPTTVNLNVDGLSYISDVPTKLDILKSAVDGGHEILLRPGMTFDGADDATLENINEYMIRPSLEFEKLGIPIRGISVASTTPDDAGKQALEKYTIPLFEYSDGYGTLPQYSNSKAIFVPSNFADLNAFKAWIDTIINGKEYKTIVIHRRSDAYTAQYITDELLSGAFAYIKEQMDAGNLDVMTWGEAYDTYRTTDFEKRLSALENA